MLYWQKNYWLRAVIKLLKLSETRNMLKRYEYAIINFEVSFPERWFL